jgi:hypothetical protein
MSGVSYLDLYHSGIKRAQFSNIWISNLNSNTVLDYIESNVFKNLLELMGLIFSSFPSGGIVVNLS